MCTVSWAARKDGYRLFFNRDEQRSRAAGEPPRLWEAPGGVFLAPRDPEKGGTWIGTNAAGWTLAILNFYEKEGPHAPGRRSRGEIVREFAPLQSMAEVQQGLAGLDLADFAPFHLLVVDPAASGMLHTWDGHNLRSRGGIEASQPITTSSHDRERVQQRREAIFHALMAGGPPTPEALAAFHRHYDHTDGAASVCMRREDAETVSLTEVLVSKKEVLVRYFPRDPSNGGFLPPDESRLTRA